MTAFPAAILALARKRWRHPIVLPVVLLGGALLIDAGMWALGVSPDEASALGLLMEPVETGGFSLPWVDAFSVSVNVRVLIDHASEVVVATAVTAIVLLLNATPLEISEHTQGDLDRELRSNGFANLLVGACGGVISNISLNRTQANIASGATSRLSAIVNGGLCLAAIFVGPRVIEWVPTPVVASLLIYLGGLLIWDWFVRPWSRLTVVDIALVTAIPVLAVERGYLEAAGLGVVASCIIFALNYSRMRVVKHDLTRREYSSHVDRSPQQTECLKSNGDLIHIMWIQGYLFFGTANWLFEGGKARLKGTEGRPVRYLILDLSNIIGIDSGCSSLFCCSACRWP